MKKTSSSKIFAGACFCVFFLFLFAPAAVFATSLTEYRENIGHLKNDISKLLVSADGTTQKEMDAFESEVAGELNTLIPASEKIEWTGSVVETDNKWLIAKFTLFQKEPKNSPKRVVFLYEIYERLDALEQKVAELEKPAVSDRSKDEDKQKLAEILRREEYQKPEQQEESFIQRIIRKIREWLNEKFPRPNLPNTDTSGFRSLSFILQMVLYAVLLGGIAFLIYRFAPFFVEKFRRRNKKEKSERVILGETLAADETAQSLFSEAEALAREGNLRGAIRKGYIALLCELSDRKIIGLARHKTNRDYLRDVRKKQELHRNMNGLTNSFERHWYGFESVAETDWEEFRQGYKNAVKS